MSWSSWTRSSATTSNRPPATGRSSDNPTRPWPNAPASGSRPPAVARSGGATSRAAGLLERALELTRPARLDVVLELDLAQRSPTGRRESRRDRRCRRRTRARGRRRNRRAARARRRRLPPRCSSRPIRPSTSSSGSRGRRCRCSSRRRTTPASCTSGMRSARGREHPRPLRRLGARGGAGAPPRPPRGPAQRRTSSASMPRSSHGPRPADEALRTLDALLPENPHPRLLL